MDVDRVLERLHKRLRPYCGDVPDWEIEQLTTDLFLESVRFGLAWGGRPQIDSDVVSQSPASVTRRVWACLTCS